MQEIKIFENTEFGEVRTVEIDGKTYFAGVDIARALGYSNPSKAINDHCRIIAKRPVPTTGGVQSLLFIPEEEVLRLIVSSRLPSAERLERWVFDEVLPSIYTRTRIGEGAPEGKERKKQELKVFENAAFGAVRALEIDGAPWFVGKDVTDILGYQNPSEALSDHVDDEDKLNSKTLSSLGQRGGWLINESGLYSLVLSSKLPSAKAFKRWVTSEVLPSIRKHGLYAIDEIIANPDMAIAALQALKEEREKRLAAELDKAVLTQQVAELRPKASYYDLILQCASLLSVTEISKDYGMSAKAFNKKLHELKIQYQQSGVWFLYAEYQDGGYTQTKTQHYCRTDGSQGAKTHMYWTQKGRLFLYERLKAEGILPMIERTDAA